MEILKLIFLSVLALSVKGLPSQVNSQQPQQPVSPLVNQQPIHPQSSSIPDAAGAPLDSADPPITNHYPYQSTALSPPSSGYHQPYSGSNYGNRDVYNNNQGGWSSNGGGWAPYFGVNAGTAWELSAYFGPIFWAIVIFMAVLGTCVTLSRVLFGAEIFGGMFQRIKDSAPSGKSLDLDNITNMVYQALDTYGKYAAKEARQGNIEAIKG